jgi:predicted transporter
MPTCPRGGYLSLVPLSPTAYSSSTHLSLKEMGSSTKSLYNLLLAIAFIGIGVWKLYEYYAGKEEVETYQAALAGLLVGLGIIQLYRWYSGRNKEN